MSTKVNLGEAFPALGNYLSDENLESALPNEDETSTGTGGDVSKEVNEDGTPLTKKDQDESREDIHWADFCFKGPSMEGPPREPQESPQEAVNRKLPYCPVFADQGPNGGRIFQVYITGTVEDVDNYIDVIDTLLTANEKDTFYIYEDSPGGYVASGGIIASAIHHSKAKVYTVARGLCASSAALIHSAAKPGFAKVMPFAVMMYHMSSHFAMGVSTNIATEAIDQVRYVNECLLNKAKDDGHITQEEFDKIQHGEEIFLPAKEFLRRTSQSQEKPNE